MLHILELVAGILGLGVGFSRLPDAASALAIVTPTAVGLVGLLAFVRHFVFHESDAKRLGWESTGAEFQYEVGFANLAFALVAFLAYFGGWVAAAQVAVVLGYGLYLLQAALLHTWQSVRGEGRLRWRGAAVVMARPLSKGRGAFFTVRTKCRGLGAA